MTDSKQTTLLGGQGRTRVGHCKHDPVDVYVGRGERGNGHLLNTEIHKRGWLGNPYKVDRYGRAESIELFETAFEKKLRTDENLRDAVRQLSGQTLGCWCQRLTDDGPACHAEVIAKHADRLRRED